VIPRLLALLLCFPVAVFVPGFVMLRRFHLADELRLSVSVAVSLAFLYAAGFLLYVLGAGSPAYAGVAIAILCAALLVRRELLAFLRTPAIRTLLVHYGIFVAWLLLLSLLVRVFSGGGWSGDWEEHYWRALFFCGGLPLEMRFIGIWSLTARPPLDNIVASLFMKLAGTDFAIYQLTSILLASLEFLGAASLWRALARGSEPRRHGGLLVLTALLALNPSIVQNATYPWTRALTNFFILQAAALFVAALRERSQAARRWCYAHLGLALVTHYSTVPYLIGLGLVEARFLLTRRLALREAASAALITAAPIAPWLAFAIVNFGLAGTFLSNSTVAWNASLDATGVGIRALGNLLSTMVPHPLRDVPPVYDQSYALGRARDYAFLFYQVSLPALMGSVGGPVVGWLLATRGIRLVRARRLELPALAAIFLATIVVLGIATVADDDAFGVAHVCLQPLALGALVYLAARWDEIPIWLRTVLGASLLLDATLGIGLQFWMQHLNMADLVALNPDQPPVSAATINNTQSKLEGGYVFLGDLPSAGVAVGVAAAALIVLLVLAARQAAAGGTTEPVPAP
jgi:hypothetical protein